MYLICFNHCFTDNSGEANALLMGVFALVFVVAFVIDILIMGNREKAITNKTAFMQTACFMGVAILFGLFMYWVYAIHVDSAFAGKSLTEYFSAYLTEYALSTDNIFIFVLMLSYFNVSERYQAKVLFWGVLFAILFRLIFIFTGIWVVAHLHWVLYIFAGILIYTGIKLIRTKGESSFSADDNAAYRFLKKHIRFITGEAHGRFFVRQDGKVYATMLIMVVIVLATTDLVFALDSIPAVFAISQNKTVIITSNIFAVLGLRSLFFLLRSVVNRFTYLPMGVAIILVFIGCKMLLDIFHIEVSALPSLLIIVIILTVSVGLSLVQPKIKS